VLEASKTLALSCARLEALKTELSAVSRGAAARAKRSRMAEVSLTDLRIPLAWRQQSEANLGDRKKFAIFCTVSCGAQIFDTGVKVVDRNCADISFPEVFLFSNLPPDFSLKLEVFSYRLRGEAGGGARSWLQRMVGRGRSKLGQPRKAVNFKLLTSKHLTVEDSSDSVETHDLDTSRNLSSSSGSSSPVSVGGALQLFGQLCCRLAVAPYACTEAVRTGKLSVSRLEAEPRLQAAADCLDWRLESEDTLAEDCFVSLASWRLEIWHSTAQYRRGDEPWRVVKLGAGTLVRQQEERVIVEAEDGDSVDLVCFSVEAANCWVEDIMEQAEDVTRWGGAGAQLALPAPTSPAQAGGGVRRRLKQKTASKLLLFYHRISSGDLMERNLLRNERIVRNRT